MRNGVWQIRRATRNSRLRALALIVAAMCAPAIAEAQTATEIVSRIRMQSGVQLPPTTVDVFIAGDSSTKVTGIAVTMMATLDVLQRAAAKGLNLVITHEPTFWSGRDNVEALAAAGDSLFLAKEAFIRDHRLVVWRFHDAPHRMAPDMIAQGQVRALGWDTRGSPSGDPVFDLEPLTLAELARMAEDRLSAGVVRIVGDPGAVVSRVGLTNGFVGFQANRRVLQVPGLDALVMGEDHEWETIAYAADAVTAGRLRGVVVVGHTPSEQSGMEAVSRWLGTFITRVPIEMVPSVDPFVRVPEYRPTPR